MHQLIGCDLLDLGKKEFEKKDVVVRRLAAELLLQLKSVLRSCIVSDIKDAIENNAVVVPPDVDVQSSWQKFVRNNKNNLGLTYR
mmetsp:Transcript_13460/g.22938  ORF Transcript_13460/g.22938 Transcript_13460/m.22938 type:complete len:85 (+) Transcript_13460:1030-1284(+)